jgi:hypothetical protein
MNWGYIILRLSSLSGITLCVCFLLLCGLSGIAEHIRKQKEKEAQRADRAYQRGWQTWGTMTDLRRAS